MDQNFPQGPSSGLNAAVAATLNGERVAAGLTLGELAEESGVSLSTVNRLLSAKSRDIDMNTLSAFCRALNVSPVEVFEAAVRRMDRGATGSELDQAAEIGRAVGRASAAAERETRRRKA